MVDNRSDRQAQLHVFLRENGWGDTRCRPLAGDASFRHYYRLEKQGERAVLMDAPPPQEDIRPFMQVAQWLCDRRLSAPGMMGNHTEQGFLLLEDLGDTLFSRELASGNAREETLYAQAVALLHHLHEQEPPELAAYDSDILMREVMLFSEWFLPEIMQGSSLKGAQDEFYAVWESLLAALPEVPNAIVLRDYHADNLLWLPDREGIRQVGLLDFQDALYGPVTYDLVSLLEDARRDVSANCVDAMIQRYLATYTGNREAFMTSYALLGAQRNLKIIGIFHRLNRRDQKPQYLGYLPRVWRYVWHNMTHPVLRPFREWMESYQSILPENKGSDAASA